MTGATPLRPDLGPVKVMEEPSVDGGHLINMAGVLKLASTAGTPAAHAFERAFLEAWRASEGAPLTASAREASCFQAALQEVRSRHPGAGAS